ncbi:MAG: DUF5676 family membrane protein [Patescibacteria group bacterium]|nr:DUF5676 family membrane protein [Patescibacteria group bacterium]
MFDEKKFALAVAIFFTLFSFVCGLLIWIAPNLFIGIIKPITHGIDWDLVWKPAMTFGRFIISLIEAFVLSYVLAWVFAIIYKAIKK